MGTSKKINNIDAMKLARYRATRTLANQATSTMATKDISANVQYSDINTAVSAYAKACKEAQETIAKIDEDGNAVDYKTRLAELKAKKEGTPASLLLLGFIPGLIIFLIAWIPRKLRYENAKEAMHRNAKEALQSLFLAQPMLMEHIEKHIKRIPSVSTREDIMSAIKKTKQLIKENPQGVEQLREAVAECIKNRMETKLEGEIVQDIMNGVHDPEKMTKLGLELFGEQNKKVRQYYDSLIKVEDDKKGMILDESQNESNKQGNNNKITILDIDQNNTSARNNTFARNLPKSEKQSHSLL